MPWNSPYNPYTIKGSGTNSHGNRWESRDYGPSAPNQNSYRYSNQNGSTHYRNPDYSTCYDNGRGTVIYTDPSGRWHDVSYGGARGDCNRNGNYGQQSFYAPESARGYETRYSGSNYGGSIYGGSIYGGGTPGRQNTYAPQSGRGRETISDEYADSTSEGSTYPGSTYGGSTFGGGFTDYVASYVDSDPEDDYTLFGSGESSSDDDGGSSDGGAGGDDGHDDGGYDDNDDEDDAYYDDDDDDTIAKAGRIRRSSRTEARKGFWNQQSLSGTGSRLGWLGVGQERGGKAQQCVANKSVPSV